MGNPVPNAPLQHTDVVEHLRLIATRANAIGYEQGEWAPTFDFATTGDLSPSYATQDGFYWLIGPLLHFSFTLTVTPTHSTSSGAAEIGGLPYLSATSPPTSNFPVRLSGTGITWPESDVVGFVAANTQIVGLEFQGTAAAGQIMAATDITSAVAMTVRMSGFYPIVD